jgi:hypothetical protein
MRLYRRKRGALEGLPLYLIILVVIAAVVIVILLGWLSAVQKSSLGSTTVVVSGSFSDITSASATFTSAGVGECLVTVPETGAPANTLALTINAYDTHSKSLNGVIVDVQGGDGVLNLNASPTWQQTTGSSPYPIGEVEYNTITFYMPPSTSTGTIIVSYSYSGGIANNVQDTDISVSAPNTLNC